MESRARISPSGISRGFTDNKVHVTLELDYVNEDELKELQNTDLRVRMVRWRDKRSLDQNSYFWVLVGKIAVDRETTPEEIHSFLIHEYPIMWTDEEGKPRVLAVPKKYGMDCLGGYWQLMHDKCTDDFDVVIKLKGTSDMDTKEFSWFLDRTIEEAKDLGIETLTPEELARMRHAEDADVVGRATAEAS